MMTPEERKAAQHERAKKWNEAHRERQRESSRKSKQRPEAKETHRVEMLKYAAAHREQEKARSKKWRDEHLDEVKACKRRLYLKNKESIKAKARAHYARNKEAYREYSINYKAKRRANGGRLSRGHIVALVTKQDRKCAACARDLSVSGYHLDHIVPLAKGGTHCDENVQLLCPECNQRKHTRSFDEFLRILEAESA